jgi:hypothetical protein
VIRKGIMQTTHSTLAFFALLVGFLLLLSKVSFLLVPGLLLIVGGIFAPFYEDQLRRVIHRLKPGTSGQKADTETQLREARRIALQTELMELIETRRAILEANAIAGRQVAPMLEQEIAQKVLELEDSFAAEYLEYADVHLQAYLKHRATESQPLKKASPGQQEVEEETATKEE